MTELDQMREHMLTAIAAASGLDALEACRVEALGKQGRITQLLKTLGGMSPEERQVQGPQIQGLREAVANCIVERKATLERAALDARLASETLDMTLPVDAIAPGTIHPVSQVMDELAEISRTSASRSRPARRSRTTGTTLPRSTSPKRIRRGRCTIPSTSPIRSTPTAR